MADWNRAAMQTMLIWGMDWQKRAEAGVNDGWLPREDFTNECDLEFELIILALQRVIDQKGPLQYPLTVKELVPTYREVIQELKSGQIVIPGWHKEGNSDGATKLGICAGWVIRDRK